MRKEIEQIESDSIVLIGLSNMLNAAWVNLDQKKKDDTIFAVGLILENYAEKIHTNATDIDMNY